MTDAATGDTVGAAGQEDQEHQEEEERLLLLDELEDRLAAFNAFRKSDDATADAILTELGASDGVDRDIVLELAAVRPLGHPDRFPAAHAMAIRSLEVLDRNGARAVPVRGLGPLGPVAAWLVQLVTRFIVRNHQRRLVDDLRRLYARREANCLPDDPARRLLRRARVTTDAVAEGFRRNPLGVPTFLLGGAAFSTVVGSVQRLVVDSVDVRWARLALAGALFVVLAAASWVVLRGAAVARRRIALTTDRPFAALYETIGRCGRPPRDQARTFALWSLVLLAAGWLVIPVGVALSLIG
ncbi:MAG: hypothetical protein D6683_11275 [Actinomyces sp.]|nr:MAG: hypothetical protein D6683_11275 [Actinomyces sp.]